MTHPKTYAGFRTPSAILLDSTLGLQDKRTALMGWRRRLEGAQATSYQVSAHTPNLLEEIDQTLARLNRATMRSN